MENPREKKFVRYKEGAEMYSISQSLFERLAKASGACYKIGRAVIVDCREFEKYLESYKMHPEYFD